jgi:CheY-like chemotaxis protein
VFDLLHELQSHDDTAELPVILCTSLAQRIQLDDVRKYGVVSVLDKATVTPKLLQEAVEQAVE